MTGHKPAINAQKLTHECANSACVQNNILAILVKKSYDVTITHAVMIQLCRQ